MNFLKKQGSNVLNLVKTQEPDKLVRKLAVSEEILKKNGMKVFIFIHLVEYVKVLNGLGIIDENFKLTRDGLR